MDQLFNRGLLNDRSSVFFTQSACSILTCWPRPRRWHRRVQRRLRVRRRMLSTTRFRPRFWTRPIKSSDASEEVFGCAVERVDVDVDAWELSIRHFDWSEKLITDDCNNPRLNNWAYDLTTNIIANLMETLILLFIYYQHIANIPTTLKIILFFIFTAEVNRYVMLQHEIVMKNF